MMRMKWTHALAMTALLLAASPALPADQAPGTYEQAMSGSTHNNWVAGQPVTDPVELWRVDLKTGIARGYRIFPVFIDGVFYMFNDGKVRGYNAGSGKEVFPGIPVPRISQYTQAGLSVDKKRLYVLVSKKVAAYDRQTGKEVWSLVIEGKLPQINKNNPVLYKDKVYFVSARRVQAVSKDTGKEAWHFDLPEEISNMPAVGNGVAVFGCYPTAGQEPPNYAIWYRKNPDAKVWGLDADTGKVLWKQVAGKIGHSDNPAIFADRVFTFHRNHGVVVARELTTGKPIWEYNGRVEPRSYGLAVDGRYVVGGGKSGHLTFCVDYATGKRNWVFNVKAYNWQPAIIVGDHVYLAGSYFYPYHVWCVRLKDGKLIWSKEGAEQYGFGDGKLLYRYYDPSPQNPKRAGKGYVVCVGQKGPPPAPAEAPGSAR